MERSDRPHHEGIRSEAEEGNIIFIYTQTNPIYSGMVIRLYFCICVYGRSIAYITIPRLLIVQSLCSFSRYEWNRAA